MTSSPYDGRYAPSPTGDLHLGNLRTALVAWLCARREGARFVLRVDDLDPDRSRPEHERSQLADLHRLGLDWDGEPVRQSERIARYEQAVERLRREDRAYPCFCSRAEVRAAAGAPHGGEATYPGTCAARAPSESARRVAAGEEHCLRVRAEGTTIGYVDGLLGPIEASIDDFVVRRRDGVPAYNLATTLDDADLAIGEVVRGADLAVTATRQIWLASVLGVDVPSFLHVPLVLGPDGARLAKRHGAASMETLAELGIDATQVLGLLAQSIGLSVDGPVTSASELLPAFERRKLPTEDVRIDPLRLADRAASRVPGWDDVTHSG